MKMYECWLKFHWSVFLRVRLTIFPIGSGNGLALIRRQAIIWTNADLIHWCIYASLGEDELTLNDSTPLQGAVSIRKTVFPGMAIPMLKIRRPTGRLIFNMGIPIPGKTVFYIETGPCCPLTFLLPLKPSCNALLVVATSWSKPFGTTLSWGTQTIHVYETKGPCQHQDADHHRKWFRYWWLRARLQ